MVDSSKFENYSNSKKSFDPAGNLFVPKTCVAWLIGVQHYDRVRNAPSEPKPHCHDLNQVPEDISNMTLFFEKIRFDRIIKTENPNEHDIDKAFTEVRNLMRAAHKDRSKAILLYVYFSGHGVLDYTTKIVLNEVDPMLRYFDLEFKMSALSKLRNNFISVVFDCCREELPRTATRGISDPDDIKNF